MDPFKTFDPTVPIAIIGTGTMGTKVAWACARAGIPTRAYDASAETLRKSMARALTWSEGHEREVLEQHLHACDDLSEALDGAQLAFENVPEVLDLKRQVLGDLGRRLAPDVYVGSNTSSLRATPLAEASGRATRYFNLNWGDPRSMRLVELMAPQAAAETLTFAKAWARHVGMVPIHVRKEQMGYAFNRLWRVIKKEVLRQIDQGVVSPEDIDRAWMLAFGTPYGPCGLMDMVSLPSVQKIEQAYYQDTGDESDKPPTFLDEMIARGRLGEVAGRGFHTYPHPAYEDPSWLSRPD